MINNYFDHPALSNSGLSKLKRELTATDAFDSDDAFHFGSLVDAAITEHKRLDYFSNRVDGISKGYSSEQWNKAMKMRNAFMRDSFCKQLLQSSILQHEVYTSMTFDFATMECRCKYDGFLKITNWGWDLKTMAANSQAQFEASIEMFDWDRGAYFYSTCTNSDRFLLIGISKEYPHEIFKKFIFAGDPCWNEGMLKTNDLAFKYYMLKHEG